MHSVDPTGPEVGRSGEVVGPAQPFRLERTGPQPGPRLRCPLIMYAGERQDNREDLAVIGRHLHRVNSSSGLRTT